MNIKGHIGVAVISYSVLPIIYINSTISNSFINESINTIMKPAYFYFNSLPLTLSITYMFFYLFLTIIGSKLPDLDLYLKYLYPKRTPHYYYHRQITHSILLSTILLAYSIYSSSSILWFIVVGMVSHLLADIVTGSIPILIYAPYYQTFSRIGTHLIMPKKVANKFNKKVVKFFDRYYWALILISPTLLIYPLL